MQPIANYYPLPQDADKVDMYPLQLMVCFTCYHAQLSITVKPDLIFRRNYPYVSGTTDTLRDYFKRFAAMVSTAHHGFYPRRVLEIACNDGSQLKAFKALGWEVQGVDPARNITVRARKDAIPVIDEYWTDEVASRLSDRDWHAIVAQNVIGHVGDPAGFLSACRRLMGKGTVLYLQTSQANMFSRGEFDTVYHEHLSYFSIRSMWTLMKRVGLTMTNVSVMPVHGDSFLFTAVNSEYTDGAVSMSVTRAIDNERKSGRYSPAYYNDFSGRVAGVIAALKDTLRYYSSAHTAIGYGAAAKGVTFINAADLDLACVIDDNSLKVGRVIPGRKIPIKSAQDGLNPDINRDNLVIVPLAWNFYDEIVSRIRAHRPGNDDIIIKYFPRLEISRA
jgi:SAM-dependent methyltransferase